MKTWITRSPHQFCHSFLTGLFQGDQGEVISIFKEGLPPFIRKMFGLMHSENQLKKNKQKSKQPPTPPPQKKKENVYRI